MTDITLMPLNVDYIVTTKRQQWASIIYDIELVYGDVHHFFRLNNEHISPERDNPFNPFLDGVQWLQQVIKEKNVYSEIVLFNDQESHEIHSLIAWYKAWQTND